MAHIRAQCVFPTITNLPKDNCTNTWHFNNLNSEFDFFEACTALAVALDEQFYALLWANPFQPANWLRPSAGWYINFYDMEQPTPRVPNRIDISGSTYAMSTTVIPSEVSCVLSFQGAQVSGQSQARRRGRLYLPGISTGMLNQVGTGSYPTFASTWLTRVTTVAADFAAYVADDLISWAVYSETQGTLANVVGGWVDEAPDTQRRRGQDAQSRVTWTPTV